MLKKINDKHKVGLTTVIVGIIIIAFVLILCRINCIDNLNRAIFEDIEDEMLGVFASHVSLTFISISVLSMLSDKSNIIYWKDIVETRLIEPIFSCFKAYTTYSIATIVLSLLGLIIKNALLFSIGFLANIVILILLTKSMLDVYYNRDVIKKGLEADLLSAYKKKKEGDPKEFNDIMFLFNAQVIKHVAANDIVYMDEVIDLFFDHSELLNDSDVKDMIRTIAKNDTNGFLIDCFIKDLNEKAKKNINEYKAKGVIPSKESINFSVEIASWESYVSGIKNYLTTVDIQFEDGLVKLANTLKERVRFFYNMLLPIYLSDKKIDGSKTENYLLAFDGGIKTVKEKTLEKEIKSEKDKKIILSRKKEKLNWSKFAKNNEKTSEVDENCQEHHNQIEKELDNEIKSVESIIEKKEEELKNIKETGEKIFSEMLNSYFDECWDFIYLMQFVLIEIYGTRVKNAKNEDESEYEKARFKYWFEDFPFYKLFASDEFMPDDAFPEHREFIDFLTKS